MIKGYLGFPLHVRSPYGLKQSWTAAAAAEKVGTDRQTGPNYDILYSKNMFTQIHVL